MQKVESEISKKRTVMLAMDGSAEAESALNWYAQNIFKPDDDVVVVHCLHHTAHYTMGSVWAPVDAQAIAKAYEEETAKANRICKKIEQQLHNCEIEGRVVQTHGDPGSKLVTLAEEVHAACIVVGCRGLGTIRRTVLGSVSDYIIHHSKVPVLIYRH